MKTIENSMESMNITGNHEESIDIQWKINKFNWKSMEINEYRIDQITFLLVKTFLVLTTLIFM